MIPGREETLGGIADHGIGKGGDSSGDRNRIALWSVCIGTAPRASMMFERLGNVAQPRHLRHECGAEHGDRCAVFGIGLIVLAVVLAVRG